MSSPPSVPGPAAPDPAAPAPAAPDPAPRPFAALPLARGWPVLGQAPRFLRDPFGYVAHVRSVGRMVRVPFPGAELLYVFDPEALAPLFGRDHRRFTKGAFAGRGARVFGEGLLLAEGEHWRRQRLRMAPAFSRAVVQGFADAIEALVGDHLDGLCPDGDPAGAEVAADAEMMALTLAVAVRTLFGAATPAGDTDRVASAFSTISQYFASVEGVVLPLPAWVPTPGNRRFGRAMVELDGVVQRLIDERRQAAAVPGGTLGDDLLGRLLAGQDDDGAGMSDAQLRDEVRTLLLAGHETTAIGLACALWELSDPARTELQDGLAQDVLAVTGGAPLRASQLAELPGLAHAWKEAMRLHPPAPVFFREPVEEVVLGGHRVPAGTTIVVPVWQLHREAALYDEPLRFWPGRWARPKDRPRHGFLPFGAGPRVCIGLQLAMLEGPLILGELLRRFRLVRPPGATLSLTPAVTLRAQAPIRLRLVPR